MRVEAAALACRRKSMARNSKTTITLLQLLPRVMTHDDDLRAQIEQSLSRAWLPGYRRSLTGDDRKRIAALIVDELKQRGWTFANRREPPRE